MNWTLSHGSGSVRGVATLWWAMLGVATAVWIAVVVMSLLAARRGHAARSTRGDVLELGAEPKRIRVMIGVATALTIAVLLFFMGYDFALGRQTPQHQQGGLTVTVQARQFWWEFIYDDTVPSQRFSAPNELHVPIKTPVNLVLKSSDVIHSAWVPHLSGKQDLVPGYTGSMVFQADTAGVYNGFCAEFCGAQHANMRFLVIAHEPKDYEDWKTASRTPSTAPTDSVLVAGQRAFLSGSCAICHSIAGTEARGSRGPDLTHVGSRRTLASGTLINTHDNMLRWIYNPQAIKPGTYMPPSNLPPETLQPLVAYLRSLK